MEIGTSAFRYRSVQIPQKFNTFGRTKIAVNFVLANIYDFDYNLP